MPVDYQRGKIYCIRSHQCEEVYVGSTCQELSVRMGGHRRKFKRYNEGKKRCYLTSFELIKYPDCYIELIEYYPCNTRAELNVREGKYIRELDCVNKVVAGRTDVEYRQDNKDTIAVRNEQYYQDNKDAIAAQRKQYYQDNKTAIVVRKKQYYQDNKDAIAVRKKHQYENNKDRILNKYKERVQCMCGREVSRINMARHRKSKTHRIYIFNLHNIFNHL